MAILINKNNVITLDRALADRHCRTRTSSNLNLFTIDYEHVCESDREVY